MFCIQCEQTLRSRAGAGCAYARGVCGKTAETSDLQDLLIAVLQGLSAWAVAARQQGITDHAIDSFVPRAFFATLTNVNFDSARIISYAHQAVHYRQQLKAQLACVTSHPHHPAAEIILNSEDPLQLQQQAADRALTRRDASKDIHGLRLLCLYGLKGAAAYMEHAHTHGYYQEKIYQQFHQMLAWLGTLPDSMDELLQAALEVGKMNYAIMAMLDEAQTSAWGHPQPVRVNTRPLCGKAILISGHDLKDLQRLLDQTAGRGIHIYTHGEMLPAHGYPGLKKYPHLAGNYGGGWQDQQQEFAHFPGPIIMTSNCLIDPFARHYQQRLWTRNVVGWPGVRHLTGDDFSAVIEQALSLPGFPDSQPPEEITVGFGRQQLLRTVDTLTELLAQNKLRHLFLIGGCDGSRSQRSYFTELAISIPQDCLILTLGCGKYRFNQFDFGTLCSLPRLLDIGQCNDSYAAIVLAVSLAEKLDCQVNDLPLTLVLSWFEQKAIAVLLTLLALGVKNIRTGPTPPAFLSDNLLALLHNKFGLQSIATPGEDLKAFLGQ
ncbi:hydroxylamine reductase [Erwinia papayae]|uniref:Hydroxylamine reductase n=1 Tax=Erwinia papayae TaxID=206499 RepID=A0ABV3MWE7_9GAMM